MIRILTKNTKGLKGAKKGKAVIFDSFSVIVHLTSELSNSLHEELSEIASLFIQKNL